VGRDVALFVLAAVFIAIESSARIEQLTGSHVHFLLVAMTAGFVVENWSSDGDRLIRGIERSSLPVYVVFFTLSGVGLDLVSLRDLWWLALLFATTRAVLLAATTRLGARLAGESTVVRQWSWTAFVAQAGISLGLAELVALRYPGWGDTIKTVVLAMIAINQVIGPVLFRWALRAAGEENAAREDLDDQAEASPGGAAPAIAPSRPAGALD
jgi:hypothetical protein